LGLQEAVEEREECRTENLGGVDICDVVDSGCVSFDVENSMTNTRKPCQAIPRTQPSA
jgi:hypothetical protein